MTTEGYSMAHRREPVILACRQHASGGVVAAVNGWVALPLVLSAVLITAGSELERMAVRPGAEVELKAPEVMLSGGETIIWKTIPQPALEPPSASLPLSPLLARAQENQAQEKTPKLTSKPDQCKLRRSRSRSCRRRG